MAVMVLDGDSRAAVETVQALGQVGMSSDVSAETDECLAFHSKYVRRKFRQPPQPSSPVFVDWLQSLDAEHSYELIVPCTEASLLGLRKVPTGDRLRSKAVLPSDEALDIALDKQRTLKLAARLGLRVPKSVLIESAENIPAVDQYPVVLKPIRSKLNVGGKLVTVAPIIASDEAQRLGWLNRWLPLTVVLQQEYIVGRGLGVELLFGRGQEVWHFAHERIHELPLTGGASTYRRSQLPPAQALADSRKLLSALEWHGVAMVEFKVDKRGVAWLMEINPRFWGSLALAIDAGVNFPAGLLRMARGEAPLPQPKYRTSYYTRDLQRDINWIRMNMRADRKDSLLLTQLGWSSFLQYFRPLLGKESWDHFDSHDLGVTGAILKEIARNFTNNLRGIIRTRIENKRIARHHRRLTRQLVGSKAPRRKLLFLCSGNICRSPLAEELAKRKLAGYEIHSAGLNAKNGTGCPPHILSVANSLGINLSEFRPTSVSKRDIDEAELVLVMDSDNYNGVAREFPEAMGRVTALGLFASQARVRIADPFLADEEETRVVSQQIQSSIDGLASWLKNGANGSGL
jgi:protein-tyrosine-phosphatase/predicted ATP-grasp superfamily ATP-dependent carboligase